jgi:hypothetical protein
VAERIAEIKYLAARVVEGIVTLTAVIFMLLLAAVLAYALVASCTGQFEGRSDDFFRYLTDASHYASIWPPPS